MALKALMVDVDGVVITPRLGGWAADLEADLGVSKDALAERFFAVHWDDVVLGRAGLHERPAPVVAEIAPEVTSQQLAAYWFAKDSVRDFQLLDDLALLRARGVQVHLATVRSTSAPPTSGSGCGSRSSSTACTIRARWAPGSPTPPSTPPWSAARASRPARSSSWTTRPATSRRPAPPAGAPCIGRAGRGCRS